MQTKFIISQEVFEKCEKFANDSVESNKDKYARRNQLNVPKITLDIRNGKIAEQCVADSLREHIPNITNPDYNVYDKKNKSWDSDLKDVSRNMKIAVKSQDADSAKRYGESWVFQYGNGKKDCDVEIFKKNDSLVVFVLLDIKNRVGEIRAVVKNSWLKENSLFKEMKLEYLRNNKVAVYYDDLKQHQNLFDI